MQLQVTFIVLSQMTSAKNQVRYKKAVSFTRLRLKRSMDQQQAHLKRDKNSGLFGRNWIPISAARMPINKAVLGLKNWRVRFSKRVSFGSMTALQEKKILDAFTATFQPPIPWSFSMRQQMQKTWNLRIISA